MDDAPVFAAIADPTRRRLLAHLAARSPRTATQLADDFPITRQGILKHLQILEGAGLVAASQQGRERRYTLRPEPLRELDRWVEEIGALWDARLLRLKAMLEEEQEPESPSPAAGEGEGEGGPGSPHYLE